MIYFQDDEGKSLLDAMGVLSDNLNGILTDVEDEYATARDQYDDTFLSHLDLGADDLEQFDPVDFTQVVHKSMFDALHWYMTGGGVGLERDGKEDDEEDDEDDDEAEIEAGEEGDPRDSAELDGDAPLLSSGKEGMQGSLSRKRTDLNGGKSLALDEGQWETVAADVGDAEVRMGNTDTVDYNGDGTRADANNGQEPRESSLFGSETASEDSEMNESSEDEWDDGDDDLG